MTDCRVTRIAKEGVTVVDGKSRAIVLPADTVIAASPARSNQELFAELEWSIDELYGCGDALVPRGLTRAIHDGYRLGCWL